MRITHLGHACVLVEAGSTRVLIDPGTYAHGFEELDGLDAVLVTHQHPDHLDPGRLDAVTGRNPKARLLFEPETVAAAERGEPLAAGDTTVIGDVAVEAVGGRHAFNHDQVPTVGNVGLLVRADDRTFFHPGDAYDATPSRVDVLGLPINAPWCAVRDTLAFLRAIRPSTAFPIHDGLLSAEGRAGYLMHVENAGPPGMTLVDLADGNPYDVG